MTNFTLESISRRFNMAHMTLLQVRSGRFWSSDPCHSGLRSKLKQHNQKSPNSSSIDSEWSWELTNFTSKHTKNTTNYISSLVVRRVFQGVFSERKWIYLFGREMCVVCCYIMRLARARAKEVWSFLSFFMFLSRRHLRAAESSQAKREMWESSQLFLGIKWNEKKVFRRSQRVWVERVYGKNLRARKLRVSRIRL